MTTAATRTRAPKAVRLDQQLTAEFMTVTPAKAEEWLGKNTGNRNIRPTLVERLARDLATGAFEVTGESIKFDWNGRLIDGQHRLHAILVADEAATVLVVRGLDPSVQAILDAGARRTAADALRMRGTGTNANRVVIAASIRQLVAIEAGHLQYPTSVAPEVTHSEVIEWYANHAEEITTCAAMARNWSKRLRLWPGTLASALYLTSQVDPLAAYAFFSDMAEMTLRPGGDPRRALLERVRKAADANERMNQSRQLFWVLTTWNAWRANRKHVDLREQKDGRTVPMPTAA